MKRNFICLWAVPLCLLLSGCTLANFFLSGCGDVDVDLVVTNDSPLAVGSITLNYGDQTEAVSNADGSTLLKQGEAFGLELEEDAKQVVVTLAGLDQRELARCMVEFGGERLYLTLQENGALSVSEEEGHNG